MWNQIVPDDASKLSDFQTIRQLTSEFETSLKEVMFISSSKDERLTNFTDNVEVHFATRKKVEILATARDLLLHSDFKLPKVRSCQSFPPYYNKPLVPVWPIVVQWSAISAYHIVSLIIFFLYVYHSIIFKYCIK